MAEHRKPTLSDTLIGGNTVLKKISSTSTRRAVRTGIDMALGVLAVIAVIVPMLHEFGVSLESEAYVFGLVLAATTLISKVKNKLEDLGYLPAFLKDDQASINH
ncbi:hypothetical protein [Kribbella italica]|uniref:Kef-type K+ transport system membrane component KefB n=1 Tax=Kribbella italica TaxID=1540520 RepID=A0A7W9MRZ9_9ACTN|nr:hypothetical protein [Kribbella italica]MBB5833403.1 Kef-type K+ transport system membrane component KefB [Kribbella italica]